MTCPESVGGHGGALGHTCWFRMSVVLGWGPAEGDLCAPSAAREPLLEHAPPRTAEQEKQTSLGLALLACSSGMSQDPLLSP